MRRAFAYLCESNSFLLLLPYYTWPGCTNTKAISCKKTTGRAEHSHSSSTRRRFPSRSWPSGAKSERPSWFFLFCQPQEIIKEHSYEARYLHFCGYEARQLRQEQEEDEETAEDGNCGAEMNKVRLGTFWRRSTHFHGCLLFPINPTLHLPLGMADLRYSLMKSQRPYTIPLNSSFTDCHYAGF